ncbi:MAG TPA: DUF5050 domain-containing protein [Pyrinomonadaceae bacterium]|jgi:Tol biopolymer transport system component
MKPNKSNKNAFIIGLLWAALFLSTPLIANAQQDKIAFESDRDGNPEIYVMDPDGTNQIRLTTDPAFDFHPSFRPDGDKIAFESTRDGNYEIYVMNADGSNQTRLTYFSPAVDTFPSFSPNGDKILFVSNRDGNSEVYVMNPDGSNQTRLTFTAHDELTPSFSPDGSKIVFISVLDGNPEIYVMDADGSNQTRLTYISDFEFDPKFSPDGSKIVFTSNRGGDVENYEIYKMNADGSNQIQLTTTSAVEGAPSFNFDGSKIVFASKRDGNIEIYVMNPDGTNQTRLTVDPAKDNYPSWSGQTNGGAAPPDLSNVGVSAVIDENSSAVLTGNISSPNAADGFTLTVSWGDGSPAEVFNYPAGTSSFTETHQYLDDDPTATSADNYTVSVALTTAGGTDTDSAVVTVTNAAPSLSNLALNPTNFTVGSPATLSGAVGDVGALDSHTVKINWGDGTPDTTLNLAAGAANFSAAHVYNSAGGFTVAVTATDDDGGMITSTLNTSGIPPAVPAAPINLKVDFVGANQVNLKWADNSGNESGFVVEQCRNKNCSTFVEVGQVGANATTFLDTGLLNNTQYNYRVRAVNAGGGSAYSNTVTAKTLRR